MKRVYLTVFAALFALAVNAQEVNQQEAEAPQEVVNSFNEEFASAKDIEWQQEGNTYEAEFTMEGEEKEAHFDKSGELKMVKTEISENQLPQAVQQSLDNKYAGYNIQSAARIEKENKIKYKVEVEKDGQSKKLMFDSSGQEIEKDKMKKKHKDKKQ